MNEQVLSTSQHTTGEFLIALVHTEVILGEFGVKLPPSYNNITTDIVYAENFT
jgi:hypothetical protein